MTKCYKGVFWFNDSGIISKKIPCTPAGDRTDHHKELTSKSGNGDNHEKVWSTLPHALTNGHPFNYYPRGRVEVRHRKAIIYLTPYLCDEETVSEIKREFSLSKSSGIDSISVKADGSRHYRCYLDEYRRSKAEKEQNLCRQETPF